MAATAALRTRVRGRLRVGPPWESALALAAPLAAAAMVLGVTAPYGPSLSTDSVAYLSSAANLVSGRGLLTYTHHLLVVFPPGFPLAVAAPVWAFGWDVLTAARVVNALCLAGIVALAHALLRRHVRSPLLRVAGVAAVVGAPVMVSVSVHAWSEPLFLACALACLLAVEELAERPRETRLLAATGALLSVAFAARYAAVALWPAALVALLAGWRTRLPIRARVGRLVIVAALAGAAPLALTTRSLRITSETLLEVRNAPSFAIGEQLRRTLRDGAAWVIPGRMPLELRIAAAAVIAALALAAVVHLGRGRSGGLRTPRSLLTLAVFCVSYLVTLEYAAATGTEAIGNRLVSPLFVPAVVIGLAAIDRARASAVAGRSRYLPTALAAAVCCWCAATIAAGVGEMRVAARGDGYASARWRGSALAARLRRARPRGVLFSNRPDALWATTRLETRCPPPQLGSDLCVAITGATVDLARIRAGRPGYLAYFGPRAGRDPVVRRGIRFRVAAREPDGTLYELRR